MDCLSLLRLSARLVDLHDSARLPGNSPVYTDEGRAGLKDGRYLSIASTVVDALRNFAHETGNAFSGFDTLLITVRESLQHVDPDDLRYVLNVLARPTELWTLDAESGQLLLVSDKQTNLVEKTFFADDYRLTQVGRAAINVTANIGSFAYAEGDALKLLRAIEAGDFQAVPVFCDSLLDTIRFESVDLRQEHERGQIDASSPFFKVKLPKFRAVIQQTSELLRTAESRLRAIRTAVDEEDVEGFELEGVEVAALEHRVLKVYQALESFSRDLANLTGSVAHRKGSAVQPMDFLDAALGLVKAPPTAAQMRQLLRNFGPIALGGVFPSPVDVAAKVRVDSGEGVTIPSFQTARASDRQNNTRIVFIGEFGEAIRTRLEQAPLPLSEAVRNGWCFIEGDSNLGELVGVYVSPWSLATASEIEVRIPARLATWPDDSAGPSIFHDLELALRQGESP